MKSKRVMTPELLADLRGQWAEWRVDTGGPEPDHVLLVEELEAVLAALGDVVPVEDEDRDIGIAERVGLLVGSYRELDGVVAEVTRDLAAIEAILDGDLDAFVEEGEVSERVQRLVDGDRVEAMARRDAAERAGIQDPDDSPACLDDFVDTIVELRAEVAMLRRESGDLVVQDQDQIPEWPSSELVKVLVNGEDYDIRIVPGQSLATVRSLALAASNNCGRPPGDWAIYDRDGLILSPDGMSDTFGGSWLFLGLRMGAGGVADGEKVGSPEGSSAAMLLDYAEALAWVHRLIEAGVHRLIEAGEGDGAEAEALRGRMDALFAGLNDKGEALVRRLSARIDR